MDITPRGYYRPTRRGTEPDRADIEILSDNWGKLDGELTSLETSGSGTSDALAAHIADHENPHEVTPGQIGAPTVEEVDNRLGVYDGHLADTENPHDTTASQVGAYTVTEVNDLLEDRVPRGGELGGELVLVTDPDGNAVTAFITTEELGTLTGIGGNIQEQLNNISFYNYLSSLPMITLSSGGDDFPEQSVIDEQVIPLISAQYPNPAYRDAVIQNIETQNGTQRRAELYSYFDGTQSDGFIGWRYITFIDTLINRANGTVYGVVRDSDDISWTAGEGLVNHAVLADLSEATNGIVTQTLGADGVTTDLNTLYGLEHNEFYVAGSGNTVANKPTGVDAFGLFVQRVAGGYTLQALYCSTSTVSTAVGLWYRQWNGSAWSTWVQLAQKYLVNSGTVAAPRLIATGNIDFIPGGLSAGVTMTAAAFRPFAVANGSIDLGTDMVRWRTGYFSSGVVAGLVGPGTGALTLRAAGGNRLIVGSGNVTPAANLGISLGSGSLRFAELYGRSVDLTGTLTCATPTATNHATTKAYVDAAIAGIPAGSGKVYSTMTIGTALSGYMEDEVDFLCTGSRDQEVINEAIQLLPQKGGKIILLEGSYQIDAPILIERDSVTLCGMGAATRIEASHSAGPAIDVNMALEGFDVKILDLYIENMDLSGSQTEGIKITNLVTFDIQRVEVQRFFVGLSVNGTSSRGVIDGNRAFDCETGIRIDGLMMGNITNNNISGFQEGIFIGELHMGVVSGNIAVGGGMNGLMYQYGTQNTITGNNFSINGMNGIYIGAGVRDSTIVGNAVVDNGHAGVDNSGIRNTITGNGGA